MKNSAKNIYYDNELGIEAYRLAETTQTFPAHFHNHYVIGYAEKGERRMKCLGKEIRIHPGNIILFNPGDSHSCTPADNSPFGYIGLNISEETMESFERGLPAFTENIAENADASVYIRTLYGLISNSADEFEKEEAFLLLIQSLNMQFSGSAKNPLPDCKAEVEKICGVMQSNLENRITLNQLCAYSNLSKSALLRAFSKNKGVTPYRYLQTLRICEAKRLLQNGVSAIETASRTGFADQSHFTKFFRMFTGLSPAAYSDVFKK